MNTRTILDHVFYLLLTTVVGCIIAASALSDHKAMAQATVPSSNTINPVNVSKLTLTAGDMRMLTMQPSEPRFVFQTNSEAWLTIRSDRDNANWHDAEKVWMELRGVEPEILHRGDGTIVIHFKKKQ